MFAVLGPATIAASMAIDRPEATDAAPVCGPQRSGGCQPGEFLASRGMGGPGSLRDLSRGVVPQGKKVAGRHCGIGGRGEGILRSDPAIEEAVWGRRDLTATHRGRNRRTPATESASARLGKRTRVQTCSAIGLGLSPRHRKTTTKASAIYRQRAGKAASSMGVPNDTAISVFRRLFPPMPDHRPESAATGGP